MRQVVFVTVNPNHILQVKSRAYFPVHFEFWHRDDHIAGQDRRCDYVFVLTSRVCLHSLAPIVISSIEPRVVDGLHKAFGPESHSHGGRSIAQGLTIPNDSVFVIGLFIAKIDDLKFNTSRGAEWLKI